MSMEDIKTDITFGATVAVTSEELKTARVPSLLDYKQERMAQDLGMKIAEEKGWSVRHEDDLVLSELKLYVFTNNELKDYMDAKFKAKLQYMAATEDHLTSKERQLLMDQSERF